MPTVRTPAPAESPIEILVVGTAIEELERPTDDEASALRRALLVLALITDHGQQRDAVRVFRSFLLSGFDPLTRAFADGKHALVGGLETLAWPTKQGVSLRLNVEAVKNLLEAAMPPGKARPTSGRRVDRARTLRDCAVRLVGRQIGSLNELPDGVHETRGERVLLVVRKATGGEPTTRARQAAATNVGRPFGLDVWATTAKGKVLNIAWDGDEIDVVTFRRGLWEDDLIAEAGR